MNVNSAFFGNKIDELNHLKKDDDPFIECFNKQKDWHTDVISGNAFVKDLIYRQDFDHPLSFHNQTLH